MTGAQPAWHERRVMVFAGQHDTRIRTGEDYDTATLAGIFAMPPGNRAKGASLAFIPSTYRDYDGREHRAQRERGAFVALTGDVDKGDHALERIKAAVGSFAAGAAWLIYSSAHARPGDMRWRIVMPLDAPVVFPVWYDAQHALFAHLEAAGIVVDRALDRAAQPVYLPNVPRVHDKSGTDLRGSDGAPLFYRRASTDLDALGIRLDAPALAAGMATIRRNRERDERERERIKADAQRRRAARGPSDDGAMIDSFNAATSVRTLLDAYGYAQDPRGGDDYRSPHQSGETYATRVFDRHWISLSSSDVAAGLGRRCGAGCWGDAYDLFVHFEHGGSHRAAFRQIHRERQDGRRAEAA